jgi:hypothetical protein
MDVCPRLFIIIHLSAYYRRCIAVVAKQSIEASCLVDRCRFFFFKIAYLKYNWRCKLGMHELSSAERNAGYRIFFELLNNRHYQVILNLLSVSYRKICSVMHQLHNRKVSEKRLLIMVNCFSVKISFLIKETTVLLYVSLLCYFTCHCLDDLILNLVLW